MRIKKGFTLAEILIVLMVIGVIATMTIPSLMKGVAEAQYKAGYKKAYNAIVNLAAMERISGQLPTKRNQTMATNFFASMANSLSVKEYVADNALDSGIVVTAGEAVPGLTFTTPINLQVGLVTGSGTGTPIAEGTGGMSWLVTDDGLAYSISLPTTSDSDCWLKAQITAGGTDEAKNNACLIVVVDVNGLYKGPNRLERQLTTATTAAAGIGGKTAGDPDLITNSTTKMQTLTRDRYLIYLGSDGATAGPVGTTVSGRIVADLK